MIAASGIELRAGSRLLLDGATLPDRRGRPGRARRAQRRGQDHADQGPRRGRASRPPARSPAPARWATCPQDPRTGDLHIAGPRPDPLGPRPRHDRRATLRGRGARWPRDDDETRDKAMRRYAAARGASSPPRAGMPRSPRPPRIASALALDDRVLGQPLGTLSGGQRRRVELSRILFSGARDPAARRADQPPRRRLDRLAARLPQGLPGRAGGHQPRRRAARRRGQQGLPPRRQPRRARPLQRRLEGLPPAARDRRARAASASAPTPRRRPPP